jgi:hypothetical protein
MKRKNKTLRQVSQIKQKLQFKKVAIYGTIGVFALLGLTTIFNTVDFKKAKAKNINVRFAEEQVFTNDFSLPSVQINNNNQAPENTIFLQRIKPEPQPTINSNE